MASERRVSDTGEVSLSKRSKAPEDSFQDDNCTDHDQQTRSVGDYTIAWICALPLELAASCAMLDEEHPQLHIPSSDFNAYVLGSIHQHNIVMTCLPGQYGNNNAAAVATSLLRSFPNIRATLMVGIAGGCPSQIDLYLGDVVVGSRIMQYDLGKVGAGGNFQGTGILMVPDPLLNSAVSVLRARTDPGGRLIDLIRTRLPQLKRPDCVDRLFQASYDHPSTTSTCDECNLDKLQARAARSSLEPKVHYGVIASGNRVIKDGKTRDEIAKLHSAYCFEMEAAGIICSSLQCLAIRGICDYADSHKNKVWQDYAAATAAAYARDLLQNIRSSHTEDRSAVQHNHVPPNAQTGTVATSILTLIPP